MCCDCVQRSTWLVTVYQMATNMPGWHGMHVHKLLLPGLQATMLVLCYA